jgi:hypothetical protein
VKNPFNEIIIKEEVPDRLKNKVLKSINYAKLLIDITELFSLNYVETLGTLFETEVGKEQSKH